MIQLFLPAIAREMIKTTAENKDKREKSMIDKSLHGKLKAEQHEPH
jgi:hypothetical protein